MQQTPIISTSKIVVFLVFICAALMTSVFIVHMRHNTQPITLTDDRGTIFSVVRDIKPFELMTIDNKKFTQQNFLSHWTLLFFGFAHCGSVCPATLDMLNHAYVNLKKDYANLQIVLISLDPERDTPIALNRYAKSFNPDFLSATGKINEIHQLQSQLGIFSVVDGKANTNYQLQHTSSILLINPKGEWAGLFNYGMSPQQFMRAFRESMQALGA